MKILEWWRKHRRKILGYDDLIEEISALRNAQIADATETANEHEAILRSLAELRALHGITPEEYHQPDRFVPGTDPHGLG